MKARKLSLAAVLTAVASFVGVAAFAAGTVVVTPVNQQGWTGTPPGADTRPGGTVGFIADASAPGDGALQLTTNNTTTAKAQYMHTTNTAIGDITDLGYWTKQNSASFVGGDPSYQLVMCLNGIDSTTGACLGFTTLVYEPYQNGGVTPGAWQQWDVDAGLFWSSRTVSCPNGGTTAGGGGAPFYTLSNLEAMCPNAVAVGFGVNIGSNNPSYNVEADLVTFNDTTYDFELYSAPSDRDQCKNGGWATFNPSRPAGPFKNQGDCVQYFNTGK